LTLTPLQLSKVVPPILYELGRPKALVDDIVYECDPLKKKRNKNKYGVGKSFGKVLNPFNKKWDILWLDDETREEMDPCLLGSAPAPGTTIKWKRVDYTLDSYGGDSKGHAHLSAGQKKKRTATKKIRKRQKGVSRKQRQLDAKNKSVQKALAAAALLANADKIPADHKWKRFRRVQLVPSQFNMLVTMVKASKQALVDEVFDLRQWIAFADRVSREYMHIHNRFKAKDTMHLFREQTLKSAVTMVLGQLKPLYVKPLDGKVPNITAVMQPILEKVFKLSGPTREKQQKKKKNDTLYLHDCTKSKELMAAWVAKKIELYYDKDTNPTGAFLNESVEVPDIEATYCLSSTRVGRRRATASYSVSLIQRVVDPACR